MKRLITSFLLVGSSIACLTSPAKAQSFDCSIYGKKQTCEITIQKPVNYQGLIGTAYAFTDENSVSYRLFCSTPESINTLKMGLFYEDVPNPTYEEGFIGYCSYNVSTRSSRSISVYDMLSNHVHTLEIAHSYGR